MLGFWSLCGGIALLSLSSLLLDAESELANGLGLLAGALSCPAFAFFLLDAVGVVA